MSDLKTLKDLEKEFVNPMDNVLFYRLKQEAIKWVKEENKRWKKALGKGKLKPSIFISPRSILIMEFHNIAEDDLK